MSDDASARVDKPDHRLEEKRDFRTYAWGFALALLLTLVPFALVNWHLLPRTDLFIAIGILALVQLMVHFRFFLHITFGQKNGYMQLILFSALLLVIMVCATIWILTNLSVRMGVSF